MGEAGHALRVVPSGAALGADVVGVRLDTELDDATVEAIRAAWYEHQVLRFRDQRLSDTDLIAFGQRIGRLDRAPPRSASVKADTPESDYVLLISNVREGGVPIGELGDGEAAWHQDMTYKPDPPVGAILYGQEVPPEGGDTWFGNLALAYETLDPALRERIAALTCIHDITYDSGGRPRAGHVPTTDPRQAKGPAHPLVATHPVTGRRHLYLGRRGWAYVPGLSLEDSEALLDAVWAHARQPRFAWAQRWRVGDVILWDNRCTMHRRDAFDPASRRVLRRAQVASDLH